jgi:membrane-associated phospholipid phosphatase
VIEGTDAPTRATRSPVRTAAFVVYCVVLVWWFGSAGVALDKRVVVLLVCGALAIGCIGRPASEARRLLFDWLPFLAVLLLYDFARSMAHVIGRPVVVDPQIDADRLLFGGVVPTPWLQEHFYDAATPHWYDVVSTLVYVSHFFVIFVVGGWLWPRDRPAWKIFAARFFILSFAGALTFAVLPTAPPWAAAQEFHKLPHVERIASHGWEVLNLQEPEVLLQRGRAIANPYAAIPSLHAGWALLVSITLWPYVSRRWRFLLVAYPIAMGASLVYTGEHYVVDVLIGWAYVALAVVVERATRDWRHEVAARLRAHALRRFGRATLTPASASESVGETSTQ